MSIYTENVIHTRPSKDHTWSHIFYSQNLYLLLRIYAKNYITHIYIHIIIYKDEPIITQ